MTVTRHKYYSQSHDLCPQWKLRPHSLLVILGTAMFPCHFSVSFTGGKDIIFVVRKNQIFLQAHRVYSGWSDWGLILWQTVSWNAETLYFHCDSTNMVSDIFILLLHSSAVNTISIIFNLSVIGINNYIRVILTLASNN